MLLQTLTCLYIVIDGKLVSQMLKSNPGVMVFGGQTFMGLLGYQGRALMNGISALKK